MFECLYGYAPFSTDDPVQTCRRILKWKKTLRIPEKPKTSPEAIDLILKCEFLSLCFIVHCHTHDFLFRDTGFFPIFDTKKERLFVLFLQSSSVDVLQSLLLFTTSSTEKLWIGYSPMLMSVLGETVVKK